MALIATFTPSIAGTGPTYGSAASGDTCEVSAGPNEVTHWLIVKNGDVSSKTVTLATPGTNIYNEAIADKVYTVAAGAEAWIPLISAYRDNTTGTVALTWSATTSVTRAVVRV